MRADQPGDRTGAEDAQADRDGYRLAGKAAARWYQGGRLQGEEVGLEHRRATRRES